VADAFAAAASLASGETATFLSSVAGRPPASLRSWGFREIQTADGIGLIEDDGKRYRPKTNLIGLAEAVVADLAGDIWHLDEPVIGSRPPAVWLRAGQRKISIRARLDHRVRKLQGALASQDSQRPGAAHAGALAKPAIPRR
jgi:hypothetical protein